MAAVDVRLLDELRNRVRAGGDRGAGLDVAVTGLGHLGHDAERQQLVVADELGALTRPRRETLPDRRCDDPRRASAMIGSSPLRIACSAASAIAGAVLRAAGSSTIAPHSTPIARHCSATMKRWSSLQITIRRRGSRDRRVAQACPAASSDAPVSFRNCFGYSSRDSGHRRVPAPPARMTGRTDVHLTTAPLPASGQTIRQP